ncbi:kunitz trypsin inhibitor 2-like [Prunus avium]|uniref:Kunitz trypsin inhibitor 2-like n=1 Tax=Prunus avium TaxID=42229 RepID=A0A6P5S3V0_PRUAV|nr:kunitz trypsin inhibitor 2-like [Prunus avium]
MSLRLALCFLLLAFSAKPWSVAADAAPSPVLDITGKKLRTGTNYYILPVIRGRGGGLTLASTSNTTSCPLDVVQEQHEVSNGLPLTFSPVNPKKGVVRVSTDHNIKFSAATICVQSTIWKLDKFDEQTGQWFVTSGGVEGNPGRQTTSNWFKIEKYDEDYKLVFCPTVCNFCKVICRDVGIFIQDGKRRLALTDVPFKVMFKKA